MLISKLTKKLMIQILVINQLTYKQNPVCNGYRTESEINDILQSGYYDPPLDNKNVDWFVNEIMKTEKNKMSFYFKKIKKKIS